MSEEPRILIAFTTSDACYAAAFRALMRSHVHHSLIFYSDPRLWGGWWAAEIDEDGPQLRHTRHAFARISKLETWESSHDLAPGLRACRDAIGRGYDWRGLAWGLFRLWLAERGIAIETANHSIARMFCSEFVASVIKAAEVPGAEVLEPANTSPPMLLDFVRENEAFSRVINPFDPSLEFEHAPEVDQLVA